jgi:hypothetical protein
MRWQWQEFHSWQLSADDGSTVLELDEDTAPPTEEARRLIEAAPEMRELLVEMLDAAEAFWDRTYAGHEKTRALLARIAGEG